MHRDPDDRLVLRILIRFGLGFVLVLLGIAAMPLWAADYQCREPDGCWAQISENGQLRTVEFRKPDIVCTEDGWIVSTTGCATGHRPCGWEKMKTAPPKPGSSTLAVVFGHASLGILHSKPTRFWKGAGLVRRWVGVDAFGKPTYGPAFYWAIPKGHVICEPYYVPAGSGLTEVGPKPRTLT